MVRMLGILHFSRFKRERHHSKNYLDVGSIGTSRKLLNGTTPMKKNALRGYDAFYPSAIRGRAISRIRCPDTYGPMWGWILKFIGRDGGDDPRRPCNIGI